MRESKMIVRGIRAERLLLRPFREADYDDLFEFLSQLADDEFVLGIAETGDYHISVSGHQAKGDVSFTRIPGEKE